jgi:hypothetical protein
MPTVGGQGQHATPFRPKLLLIAADCQVFLRGLREFCDRVHSIPQNPVSYSYTLDN